MNAKFKTIAMFVTFYCWLIMNIFSYAYTSRIPFIEI